MAKCEPGCTCKRHDRTMIEKRNKRIGEALQGKPGGSPKCQPGCACRRHATRNSGQFRRGSAGFNRPHSEETKAKLASYRGERTSAYKHGWANTPTYWSWMAMRSRCRDPRNASYRYYGARGITVCERWEDFENFLADMGPRPSKDYSIDRIDADGNYEPANCRWATKEQQSANRKDPGGWIKRRAKQAGQ